MIGMDNCDKCDWPKVGQKILGDLSRLETTEERTAEILTVLAGLKADVRALDEKFERLEDHGTTYAHREIHDMRITIQNHALKLEGLRVRSMLWSGMGGGVVVTLTGIVIGLVYLLFKK
jgi:hypothetical protein